MTAVRSLTHIQQLAQQRLPVPSAEVERLCERVKELEGALKAAVEYMAARETEFSRPYPLDRCRAAIRSLKDKGE